MFSWFTPQAWTVGGRHGAPHLRLLSSLESSLCSQTLVDPVQVKTGIMKGLMEFVQGTGVDVRQMSQLRMKMILQLAMEGHILKQTHQVPWLNKYFRKNGRLTSEAKEFVFALEPDHQPLAEALADLSLQFTSCGIRGEGRLLYHPQPAKQFEYLMFQPGVRTLAVRAEGSWNKKDRVMIGFVPNGAKLNTATHPADVGFFFSMRSLSMVGKDGTNFRFSEVLIEAWMQQLEEGGCPKPLLNMKLSESYPDKQFLVDGGLVGFADVDWCVCLTADREFDVFFKNRDGNRWIQFCRVPWRLGFQLPPDSWCPAIIFMPRKRMGFPKCAVTQKVNPSSPSRRHRAELAVRQSQLVKESPNLRILETRADSFQSMPTFDPVNDDVFLAHDEPGDGQWCMSSRIACDEALTNNMIWSCYTWGHREGFRAPNPINYKLRRVATCWDTTLPADQIYFWCCQHMLPIATTLGLMKENWPCRICDACCYHNVTDTGWKDKSQSVRDIVWEPEKRILIWSASLDHPPRSNR